MRVVELQCREEILQYVRVDKEELQALEIINDVLCRQIKSMLPESMSDDDVEYVLHGIDEVLDTDSTKSGIVLIGCRVKV